MRFLSLSTLIFLAIFFLHSCTTPSSNGGGESYQAGAEQPPEKFSGPVVQSVADPSVSNTVFHLDAAPAGAFVLNLHNAPAQAPVDTAARKASPKPLAADEVEALLSRLPEMKQDEARAFAFRSETIKRPRPGSDVATPFPPKQKLPPPKGEKLKLKKVPLKITRHAPVGAVGYAHKVSITFSEPMIPLSSLDVVAASKIPVTLTPKTQGEWRWLDTQTLQFIPKEAFARSTRFKARVKRGTRSAAGNVLAKAFSWTFSTETNAFQWGQPSGDQVEQRPVLMVVFNQPIKPRDALATIKVKAGGASYRPKLANKQQRLRYPSRAPGQSVIFVLDRALPKNTQVQVKVGPNIPSTLGPLRSKTAGSFSFKTYGPLKVTNHRCTSYQCRPGEGTGFQFYLSNPLDQEKFNEELVTVRPKLEGQKITSSGRQIMVVGNPTPSTKYTVTLDGWISDTWKQRLSGQKVFQFKITKIPKAKPVPQLQPSRDRFLVLEPQGPRSYSVKSTNHSELTIELYDVEPEHYRTYQREFVNRFFNYRAEERARAKMPGRLVSSRVEKIESKTDEQKEISIDLTPALEKGIGQVVVLVKGFDFNRSHVAWIQCTQLGLTAIADPDHVVAWVSTLERGMPVANAGVTTQTEKPGAWRSASTATQNNGVAKVKAEGTLLIAGRGRDVVFLPNEQWAVGRPGTDFQLVWYVLDDRKLYRPGEKVRIKGWVRAVDLRRGGDVQHVSSQQHKVNYQLRDPQGNELAKGELKLNPAGGFHLAFDLPDNSNLGNASLQLSMAKSLPRHSGEYHTHHFRIEEFRRPEFEVNILPDGPYLSGDAMVVPVKANYYAGGPLPNAETMWRVRASRSSFVPPNRGDYKFGHSYPSWYGWRRHSRHHYGRHKRRHHHHPMDYDEGGLGELLPTTPGQRSNPFAADLQARTGRDGVHRLGITLDGQRPPWPVQISLESSVTDVNRQRWSASSSFQVHPSSHYLGLRPSRQYVEPNREVAVDSLVSDLKGQLAAGKRVEIRAARFVWANENGTYRQVLKDPQVCKLNSAAHPVRCIFKPTGGGNFILQGLLFADNEEVLSTTEVAIWVAGGQPQPQRGVQQQQVLLLADRENYRVGQTARVLVQSPWFPAEGTLTLQRSGVLYHRRFSMDQATTTLEVPLSEEHLPSVTLQVDLVGSAQRFTGAPPSAVDQDGAKIPPRPAMARGKIDLPVSLQSRTLSVTASPAQKVLEPGSKSHIEVQVRDHRGQAVANTEVLVVAVDEAVLALTSYQMPDPVSLFFPKRYNSIGAADSRGMLLLHEPDKLQKVPDAPTEQPRDEEPSATALEDADMVMGEAAPAVRSSPKKASKRKARSSAGQGAAGPGAALNRAGKTSGKTVAPRKNFDALMLWAPEEKTDAQGKLRVAIELPHSLTRYRIMAVAADRHRFGKGESTLTARRPLMVRPSAPRFLNYGDAIELPVVVQNLTGGPQEIKVAIRGRNASFLGQRGFVLKVPDQDRAEFRFALKTALPGRARFQIAAAAGSAFDAAEIDLPVWTPATSEAFALYGHIDDGALVQPVLAPPDVEPGFGGLEVTTTSTAVAALTDAVLYLVRYPYDCSEQISSRVLGIVSLRDVLDAFDAEGLPDSQALVETIQEDISELQKRQNSDGGVPYWKGGSVPYLSIHVAHALERARRKGFAVPKTSLAQSKKFLQNIERNIATYESRRRFKYDPQTRAALLAYAHYTRSLMGDNVKSQAVGLLKNPGLKKMSLETAGWLLASLHRSKAKPEAAQVLQHLLNNVEETAAAANFISGYKQGAHLLLHSDRRSDGVILDAMIEADPQNVLIAKVVRGLLAHRLKGHWRNTQENAFILVALERYFATYEKITPDFVARVWLGEKYAGEQTYRGRSTERQNLNIPMSVVLEGEKKKDLLLHKKGAGRLYYRIGMKYAPKSLQLDSLDRGFVVKRSYQAVGNPDEVRKNADGTWVIKSGATVRVNLSMVAPSRRYHVALVDKLPAGLEPLNPALATTGHQEISQARNNYGQYWWSSHWFEHQNLRDERVEAFQQMLREGEYHYSYVARATTPGRYIVPPAKAEEMYTPETFGRSGADRVVVD